VSTYTVLGAIANSFNPLLAILALAVPVRTGRGRCDPRWYYLAAGAAIGIVYLVRAIDDRNQLRLARS
jgi:hypothetical protein